MRSTLAVLLTGGALGLVMAGCTGGPTPAGQKTAHPPARALAPDKIELAAPSRAEDRAYLGLAQGQRLRLAAIKARVLVVEVFNMYCPHCQKAAPQVNRFYYAVQERPDLRDQVKIIGIGLQNTPFEVDLFQKNFQVPFPLLADPQRQTVQHLNIEATPTYLILRLKAAPDPSCELIDSFEGDLGSLQHRLQQLAALVAAPD